MGTPIQCSKALACLAQAAHAVMTCRQLHQGSKS